MVDSTASAPDLLVIGGSGLLGRHLVRDAAARGIHVHATGHRHPHGPAGVWHRLDLRDGGGAAAALVTRLRPRAVVNAAYLPAGDHLEAVTARAPGAIAAATADVGARLVHLSSDVVFDGENDGAYVESDPLRPVHAYGEAKAEAEGRVAARHPGSVIVRTSLLWSLEGGGGPQVDLVRDPEVTFFTDEIRSPLRADRLASAVLELVDRPEITGPIHVAGDDAVDRLTFARALAPLADRHRDELRGASGHPRAARPRRLVLDCGLARALLDAPLPGILTESFS